MSKRSLLILAFSLGGLHLLFMATGTTYVYKALIYNLADIHDDELFDNREVSAGNYYPWPVSPDPFIVPEPLLKELDQLETIAMLVVQNGESR